MTQRNIFIRDYDIKENILTENLIDFLSNLNPKILNKFLKLVGIKTKIKDVKDSSFEMQKKEEKSVPDASISDTKNFYIHIESKIVKETIRELQLENHFNSLKNKPQKERLLLVITNDYDEPVELKKFRKKYEDEDVQIKFLNWSQIRDFINNIPQDMTDKKDRFLIEQYNEFLENEKMAIIKWSGFKKEDEDNWTNILEFYENLRKILFEIEAHIKEKENWQESAIKTRENGLWFDFVVWKRRTRRCKCYIGIELSKVGSNTRRGYFYVGWHWSKRLENQLLQRRKFNESREKLISMGYTQEYGSDNNDFYKYLELKEIVKKQDPNSQRKIIFQFIDRAVRDFKECGMKKLIK